MFRVILLLSFVTTACGGESASSTVIPSAASQVLAAPSKPNRDECRPTQERGEIAGCLARVYPAAVRYETIKDTVSTTSRSVNLCELVHTLGEAAGVYRVLSLTGVPEPQPKVPNYGNPVTYVELELVEPWSQDAPTVAVVRTPGGPTGTGTTQGWLVPLTVGEEVGVLLFTPPQNKGFYAINPLGVFRQDAGGGVSNGQLFTKAPMDSKTLGAMTRQILTTKVGCAVDVAPDYLPDPVPTELGPDQVHVAEAEAFRVEN